MTSRLFAIAVCGSALAASTVAEANSDVSPPPVIAKVLEDGAIPVGSWGWMRGAFPDASATEQGEWTSVKDWLTRCAAHDRENTQRELATLGIAKPELPGGIISTLPCAQAAMLRATVKPGVDWAQFSSLMDQAGQALGHYWFGAETAIKNTPLEPTWSTPSGRDILRAGARDQVLRNAFYWNLRAGAAKLPDNLLPYFRAQLSARLAAEDVANTAMLKTIVADQGWLRRTVIGTQAANTAWLLVQHADLDPAFQLRALRLMEPLVADKEVSPTNYAYLHDRVMLKIVGFQRYGTQFGPCKAGVRELRPLEAGRDLTVDRAAMELEPIDEYRAQMDRTFGPCPK